MQVGAAQLGKDLGSLNQNWLPGAAQQQRLTRRAVAIALCAVARCALDNL